MGVTDHKCIECKAVLKFNPAKQKWVCEYCGTQYSLEDLERDKEQNKSKKNEKKFARITLNKNYKEYHCPDCGAQIVMDENTSVTACVYCGNTAIISDRLTGEFAPKHVIPFKKTKEQAVEAFSNYKKGKWFMPSEFVKKENIQKTSGVYIPFYLYDMDVFEQINVNAIKETKWSDSYFYYTRKDYYKVYRAGDMSFCKIPTDASKKFRDDIMDSIEPFDYNGLVEFNSSYMSGFLAEKYDIGMDELESRAKKRAIETAKDILYKDIIGYDEKNIRSSVDEVDIKETSYVLLPIWMLNVKYNGKIYTLAMNGQTGKFIGNVPISWKKVAKVWSIIFVIVTTILLLINLL